MPLTVANSGNSWRLASPAGAAMLLPLRSWGLTMLLFDMVSTASADLSFTMNTAMSGRPGFSPMKRTME